MDPRVRPKRATGPLDERVKACLCGKDHRPTFDVGNSCSRHDADDSASLFDSFLITAVNDEAESLEDSDEDQPVHDAAGAIKEVLDEALTDRFRMKLASWVYEAVSRLSDLESNCPLLRQAVVASLRNSGYNAAICQTRWENSGSLAGGDYEFIDVVRSGKGSSKRYLIDVNFEAEFEIARSTPRYSRLLEVLPHIFVGRPEDLKEVLGIVSEEMKRSLKSRDLLLPPWRRSRYLKAKWLGPCRRSTGQILGQVARLPERAETLAASCRCVGFVGDDSGRFCLRAPAPTN